MLLGVPGLVELRFVDMNEVLPDGGADPLVPRGHVSRAPLFASSFRLPDATGIDRHLVSGAVLFGIGWGLGGLCPGPAISSLVLVPGDVALFVVMMLAGLFGGRVFMARRTG